MITPQSSVWIRHPAYRALLGFTGVVAFVMFWKVAQTTGWARAGTIPDPFLLPQTLIDEWQDDRGVLGFAILPQPFLWEL